MEEIIGLINMINEIMHYYNIGLDFDEISNVTSVRSSYVENVVDENPEMIQSKIPSRREAYELVRDGHITPEKGATICMFDKIYRFVESYENWLNKSN